MTLLFLSGCATSGVHVIGVSPAIARMAAGEFRSMTMDWPDPVTIDFASAPLRDVAKTLPVPLGLDACADVWERRVTLSLTNCPPENALLRVLASTDLVLIRFDQQPAEYRLVERRQAQKQGWSVPTADELKSEYLSLRERLILDQQGPDRENRKQGEAVIPQ